MPVRPSIPCLLALALLRLLLRCVPLVLPLGPLGLLALGLGLVPGAGALLGGRCGGSGLSRLKEEGGMV